MASIATDRRCTSPAAALSHSNSSACCKRRTDRCEVTQRNFGLAGKVVWHQHNDSLDHRRQLSKVEEKRRLKRRQILKQQHATRFEIAHHSRCACYSPPWSLHEFSLGECQHSRLSLSIGRDPRSYNTKLTFSFVSLKHIYIYYYVTLSKQILPWLCGHVLLRVEMPNCKRGNWL